MFSCEYCEILEKAHRTPPVAASDYATTGDGKCTRLDFIVFLVFTKF